MNPCSSSSELSNKLLGVLLLSKLRSSSCYSSYSARQLLSDYVAREFNILQWVSLITVTVYLLGRVLRVIRLWREGSKLPGPPCPSFYGHPQHFSRENFVDALSGFHDMYGSIFKLWLGPAQLLVSIKDPEIMREVLLKAEDKLPLTASHRAFRLAFGRPRLFTASSSSSFEEVHKRRESLMVGLNMRILNGATAIPATVVDCIMEKVCHPSAGGIVNCEMVSQHISFIILGTALFGEMFLAWSKASIYQDLLNSIAKEAFFWASYNITPFWKRGFWKYQRSYSELKCLTQEIIHLCRKNHSEFYSYYKKSSADDTDARLVSASVGLVCSNAKTPDNSFTEEIQFSLSEDFSANIMGLMIHGYLTTSGLICNILTRLATHPKIQEEVYAEIMLGREVSLRKDQKNVEDMGLLTAMVYESARLLPARPLLQRCSLENDLHLKSGAIIPAGAVLVVPVELVQTDGSSWGKDAMDFNPYRFVSSCQKESLSAKFTGPVEEIQSKEKLLFLNDPNENAAFLPFGSGACACVGQRFVIHCLVPLFSSMLEHYEIRLQSRSEAADHLKQSSHSCALQLLPNLDVEFIKRTN